jgi:UDP-glucuronate 4-epimerase
MDIVLVTGAAGFIGSHVVERLLARGEIVVGMDNFDPFYPRAVKERNLEAIASHPNFSLVEIDIRDYEAVSRQIAEHRPRRIIHLAAKAGVRPSIQAPLSYIETNICGTLNLLRACEHYKVSQFVFASSSSVYGNAARAPFTESDVTDQPESPYAVTKKAAESLCYNYHRLLQLPVTCLRFFTVYGPRQRPDLAIHKFARLIAAGQPIPFYGDGASSRDYTYIDDIVTGVLAALDRPAGYAIYNLGNSHPISLQELVTTLEQALGKSAVLERLPHQPGDVQMTCADISCASRNLGYDPQVSFTDGIARFVEWMRATQKWMT